jgi:D-amino-acid dehydrogenase
VDRAGEVASGASGGNGGQLSYSFTDAMASPALLAKLPAILAGRNPAFYTQPSISPQMIRWGLAFLSQCTRRKFRENSLAVLRLALRSGVLIKELHANAGLEFSYRRAGKLVLLDTAGAVEEAQAQCALKRAHGCDVNVIGFDEAVAIEPALAHMGNGYAGAVYSASDEVGNSQVFTQQLARWLVENRGVELLLDTSIRRIDTDGGALAGVETDQGTLPADAVVVCMGAWSGHLLRPLGIKVNIYPMRGYSVTFPSIATSNTASITDLGSKTVFSRLGDEVRIAGFADLVGYRTGRDEARIGTMLDTARKTAPAIADFDAGPTAEWGGFRPMTPDSRPLLGPTRVRGVHLNTGHGMLGWTLACASAQQVAAGI